jgi:hypothetical protein
VVPLGRNSRTTNLAPNLVLPDDDPFYKAPPGIESAKPGAVLRTRRVPNAITFDNKKALNIKDAWQILYRSQDSQGHPEANVVTVLVPYKPKKDNHFSMAYFTVRTPLPEHVDSNLDRIQPRTGKFRSCSPPLL